MKKAFVTKVFLIIAVLSGMAVGAFQIWESGQMKRKSQDEGIKRENSGRKNRGRCSDCRSKTGSSGEYSKSHRSCSNCAPKTKEQGQDNAQTSGDNRRNEKNQRDRDRWDDDNDWDEQDDDDDDNDWDDQDYDDDDDYDDEDED